MQYLVTEELINPGPLLPPDQLVGIMRQWVLPSMDALINLKSEGKIVAGGVRVGERALVLIFEAESNEELDSILDLTRSGGHPRVWRQSLRGGSPHAEEYRVPLPRGVQGRGRSAGPLLSREIHPPTRLRARHRGPDA